MVNISCMDTSGVYIYIYTQVDNWSIQYFICEDTFGKVETHLQKEGPPPALPRRMCFRGAS